MYCNQIHINAKTPIAFMFKLCPVMMAILNFIWNAFGILFCFMIIKYFPNQGFVLQSQPSWIVDEQKKGFLEGYSRKVPTLCFGVWDYLISSNQKA